MIFATLWRWDGPDSHEDGFSWAFLSARTNGVRSTNFQKRLFALLWLDGGKPIDEVAGLLHVTARCVRDWLRICRSKGFDAVLILNYKGGPYPQPDRPNQEGGCHQQVPLRSAGPKVPAGCISA